MRASRRRALEGALVAVVTLALLTLAVLPAAAQNTGNVLTGCGIPIGDSRVLAVILNQPNFNCQNYPRYVWNRQGPRGPKGLKGPRGNEGKQGKRGERGETGPTGASGTSGANGPKARATYASSATTIGSGGRLLVTEASCDAGDLATGGGFDTDGIILSSMAIGGDSPTGWRAVAVSHDDIETSLTVMAVCTESAFR